MGLELPSLRVVSIQYIYENSLDIHREQFCYNEQIDLVNSIWL